MTDRAFFFLAALIGEIIALVAVVWLIVAHQLGTFDGNFLLLSALVLAFSFGLYLKFMIARAMQALRAPKPAAVPAEKKTHTDVPELAGKV
jgi:hypothetical protein